ncbi:MAG: hypothetical protein V5A25_06270 [Halovenus sp.]
MDRRKFLIGAGSLAAGGAAALGSGAFTRVEAQRAVSIEVATDENAYLGLKPLNTPNSNNFVELDELGHLAIDIGEHSDAAEAGADVTEPALGVNSDSFTYFDGMFEVCNQGKADAKISYTLPEAPDERAYDDDFIAPDEDYDQRVVQFYYEGDTDNDDSTSGRILIEPGDPLPLPLGECVTIGVRTVTKGVDATVDAPLIDGDVVVTANSPEAGEPEGT